MSKVVSETIDAVVIGGGIAGLWILAKLLHEGYQAILVEKKALGCEQTIASQGIIHGGTKYALRGEVTVAQQRLADMPSYWRACLDGQGDVDLSGVKYLTEHQLMWARPQLSSKITGFFASHLMRSQVQKLIDSERPAVLQNPACLGQFYALNEPVLDMVSVLNQFAKHYSHAIFTHIDALQLTDAGVTFTTNKQVTVQLDCAQTIVAAGKANQSILHTEKVAQQLRPLQMVKVEVPADYVPLYCHVLGLSDKPKLTISSLCRADGTHYWYLGGQLAEEGATQSAEQLIQVARQQLQDYFPWLGFTQLPDRAFSTMCIDRAEGARSGLRPDAPVIQSFANGQTQRFAVWPTKLVMAPMLANQLMEQLTPAKNLNRELPETLSQLARQSTVAVAGLCPPSELCGHS